MRDPDFIRDGWALENGEAYHAAAPDTFFIPSRARRESLQRGDFAKLIFRIALESGEDAFERMWVAITSRTDTGYIGILGNQPSQIDENDVFWLGAELPFRPEHIVDAMPANEESLAFVESGPAIPWKDN